MRRETLILLAASMLVVVYHAPSAQACTPPPKPVVERLPTVAERTETADVVILGTVLAVQGPPYMLTATVEVQSYLKGDPGPQLLEIGVFGEPSLCMSRVQKDATYIIFAQGQPLTGHLEAHYSPWRNLSGENTGITGQFNSTAAPTPENIQEASAAAGQEPVPPLVPTDIPAEPSLPVTGGPDMRGLARLTLLLGILAIAGGVMSLLLAPQAPGTSHD